METFDLFGETVPTTNVLSRYFSMPSGDTFSMKPIKEFIERHINRDGLVVDPFARNSRIADIRNDLNPDTDAEYHLNAVDFLKSLEGRDDITTVLFDPPYSPRQISECYTAAGLTATMKDTQNARFYKECRDAMRKFLTPGSVVLSFGWNSVGMGKSWDRMETMLVYHGGAHNDTICCADRMKGEANGRENLHRTAGGSGHSGGTVPIGPKHRHEEGLQPETVCLQGGRRDSEAAAGELAPANDNQDARHAAA